MKRFLWLLLLAIGLLAGGVAWLWVAQNADQTAMLRLDLGSMVGAWTTAEPQPVAPLLLVVFGVGVAVGGMPMALWALSERGRRSRATKAVDDAS